MSRFDPIRAPWTQRFRLGDSLSLQLNLTPRKPETLWAKLPVKSYWRHGVSALAAFRQQGQYGLVTDFAIYQFDPERGGDGGRRPGGGEMSASLVLLQVKFLPPSPNPFSDQVRLTFSLNRAARVSIRVYDASGRLIRKLIEGGLRAGTHSATWNHRDDRSNKVSNGIYFAKLVAEGTAEVHKLVLTR